MRNTIAFILILPFLSVANVVCAAGITFKSAPVMVAGPVVTLGDIAIVVGTADEDVTSLRRTLLFPAPNVGEERSVRLTELRDILSDLGIRGTRHEIDGPQRITLLGAGDDRDNRSTVRNTKNEAKTSAPVPKANPLRQARAPRAVSAQDIKILESQVVAALKVYLDNCMNAGSSEPSVRPWSITIRLTSKQAQTLIDGGGIANIYGGKNPIIGPQQFELEMQMPGAGSTTDLTADPDENRPAIITLDAEVALPVQVLVMRRTVPRGHLIGEADVALTDVLPTEMRSKDYLIDASKVLGRETLSQLREGTPITEAMVKMPAVIRKGEIVDVTASSGSINVHVRGTAKNDASVGEAVQIDREYIDPAAKNKRKEILSFVAVASDYGKATLQATPSYSVR